MDPLPPPLSFFCLLFAGWVNRQQQAVIDYLLEENRVLRAAQSSELFTKTFCTFPREFSSGRRQPVRTRVAT
jgi:hypothetical protein